nr:MAG TPA: hypothetical protein [Bacteriophage sp.]
MVQDLQHTTPCSRSLLFQQLQHLEFHLLHFQHK